MKVRCGLSPPFFLSVVCVFVFALCYPLLKLKPVYFQSEAAAAESERAVYYQVIPVPALCAVDNAIISIK